MQILNRFAAVIIFLILQTVNLFAATSVEHGDILSIRIYGEEELSRETGVDIDGIITVPQIGRISVAGLTIEEVQRLLEEKLTDLGLILKPDVMVEFASYRPFYINGAVENPGAFDFKPGLRVRQALALAGGVRRYDQVRNTPAERARMRVGLHDGSKQLVEVESRISRLRAELVRDYLDVDDLDDGQTAGAALSEGPIAAIDRKLLADRIEGWDIDQSHLKGLQVLFDQEIGILEAQLEYQKGERELQRQEVETSRSLSERGIVTKSDLRILEREESRLIRDTLEAEAFAARAGQGKANVIHDLASADAKWRISIQRELRRAFIDRDRLQTEMEALRVSLIAGEAMVERTPDLGITVYRVAAGESQSLKATMDFELLPGDVVEFLLLQPADQL